MCARSSDGHAERMRRAPRHRAVIGAVAPAAILRLPVAPRASVTQVVVASVPFLENIAQSACVTRPTSRSASSTMRSDGPFRQSPCCHLPPRRGVDDGMAVAEHDRPPAAHEVEIFAAVDVPEMAALAAREELRIAGRQTAGTHVAVHAAGHDTGGAVAQASIDRAEFGGHELSCPRCIRIYDI